MRDAVRSSLSTAVMALIQCPNLSPEVLLRESKRRRDVAETRAQTWTSLQRLLLGLSSPFPRRELVKRLRASAGSAVERTEGLEGAGPGCLAPLETAFEGWVQCVLQCVQQAADANPGAGVAESKAASGGSSGGGLLDSDGEEEGVGGAGLLPQLSDDSAAALLAQLFCDLEPGAVVRLGLIPTLLVRHVCVVCVLCVLWCVLWCVCVCVLCVCCV